MRVFLFLCLFFPVLPSLADIPDQKKINVIDLKLSISSKHGRYVKELLTRAYALVNYQVNWLYINSAKELELVDSGKLGAAIARSPIIEREFPKLIRVPYVLLKFSLVKVSNKSLCGACSDDDINSIVYTKSNRLSLNYVQYLRANMDKLSISSPHKLNELILKKRTDSVLMMDFLISPEIYEDTDMIIETISYEYDYHYLSPVYQHLAKPLTEAFKILEESGVVDELQKKFNI